ncbi:MAG: glycosyltransferase family 2 protein [Kiloniellaceae bacterium]
MKYSIVIPTQDRPKLLAIVARHVMRLDHSSFEMIVSDNSTSDEFRAANEAALAPWLGLPNVRLIRPSQLLSAPEHFEYALGFTTGDYVLYLTDKMVILPRLLVEVDAVIAEFDPDIVNWAYAPYYIDDIDNPDGSGTLIESLEFLQGLPQPYVPDEALRFKAAGTVPRTRETTREFALGKIIFGCYKRTLIDRIIAASGALFSGATHDYSAMVQGLCLARQGVMINRFGMLFLSLPRQSSLGSLTATESKWALSYFRSFENPDALLGNLLAPGVYASQHNMVAHDYKKFLSIHGKESYLNRRNWFVAIWSDLVSDRMHWSSEAERSGQIRLFWRHVRGYGLLEYLSVRFSKLFRDMKIKHDPLWISLKARITGQYPAPTYRTYAAASVMDAADHILAESTLTADGSIPVAERDEIVV